MILGNVLVILLFENKLLVEKCFINITHKSEIFRIIQFLISPLNSFLDLCSIRTSNKAMKMQVRGEARSEKGEMRVKVSNRKATKTNSVFPSPFSPPC